MDLDPNTPSSTPDLSGLEQLILETWQTSHLLFNEVQLLRAEIFSLKKALASVSELTDDQMYDLAWCNFGTPNDWFSQSDQTRR